MLDDATYISRHRLVSRLTEFGYHRIITAKEMAAVSLWIIQVGKQISLVSTITVVCVETWHGFLGISAKTTLNHAQYVIEKKEMLESVW